MKYLPLIWAGLWRKPVRIILTMLSVVIAFILFGLLSGISTAFSDPGVAASLSRLIVRSRISYTEPLPLAYRDQISTLSGVSAVTYASWFGGFYRDPKSYVVSFAVDPDSYLKAYPDVQISPGARADFSRDRNSVLIGKGLAAKYSWKVGDHIPIKSSIWPRKDGAPAWDFRVAGIFDDARDRTQLQLLLLNFEAFDQMRGFGKSTVGWFIVTIMDPALADGLSAKIDSRFRNSSAETKTSNEQQDTEAFIRQRGDIALAIRFMLGAVFFTLLFLTANTVMQSQRDAVPETAILKTIGFSNTAVFALALAETTLYFVVAAMVGLVIAAIVFPALRGLISLTALPLSAVAEGLVLAVALAVVTGLPGAMKAQRLSIIDALSSRNG